MKILVSHWDYLDLHSAVPRGDFGLMEELLAHIGSVEDPVCSRGHFLDPEFGLKARLHLEDLLEPLILSESLHRPHQL